jgi:hypothetical protein
VRTGTVVDESRRRREWEGGGAYLVSGLEGARIVLHLCGISFSRAARFSLVLNQIHEK